MKTIYFTNPNNTTRIAKTITDLPIEKLKDIGVLSNKTKYLIFDGDTSIFPDMEKEDMYFDCMTFDDPESPTKIIFDMDQAKSLWLESLRLERNDTLYLIDKYSLKAVALNMKKIASIIEKDKENLRNITEDLDLSKVHTVYQLDKIFPPILEIDYEHKYKQLIDEEQQNRKNKTN